VRRPACLADAGANPCQLGWGRWHPACALSATWAAQQGELSAMELLPVMRDHAPPFRGREGCCNSPGSPSGGCPEMKIDAQADVPVSYPGEPDTRGAARLGRGRLEANGGGAGCQFLRLTDIRPSLTMWAETGLAANGRELFQRQLPCRNFLSRWPFSEDRRVASKPRGWRRDGSSGPCCHGRVPS